jgi:hypothetical protein
LYLNTQDIWPKQAISQGGGGAAGKKKIQNEPTHWEIFEVCACPGKLLPHPAACGPAATERGGGGAGRGRGRGAWRRVPGAARVFFIVFFFSTRSARGARTKITSILGKHHARGEIIDCNQQSQAPPACDFADVTFGPLRHSIWPLWPYRQLGDPVQVLPPRIPPKPCSAYVQTYDIDRDSDRKKNAPHDERSLSTVHSDAKCTS